METITTIDQAVALPEVINLFFNVENKIIESGDHIGDTVEIRKPRKFVPRPTNPDQIVFFNENGRRMQIIYTEDGPAKTEVRY